jgi:hypothetical protein
MAAAGPDPKPPSNDRLLERIFMSIAIGEQNRLKLLMAQFCSGKPQWISPLSAKSRYRELLEDSLMPTTQSQLAIATLACAICLPNAAAQSPQFANPVRLQAGDHLLGESRLYPSPACYDINGDGRLDVFIGDLMGHVTFALRHQDGSFGNEQKLKDAEGKILDFGNW